MELLGKSKNELRDFCVSLGQPAYRGGQIYHALYAERKSSLREITNLPASLRERLAAEATITLPTVRQTYASQDGSVRYLFGLPDSGADAKRKSGPAAVEAVFMPSTGRQTICISTQAGCAVDCQFCLTAQLGLIRNLTAGEMVAQVLMPLKEMGEMGTTGQTEVGNEAPASESGPYISDNTSGGLASRTNVVLMGQGEPLLNLDIVVGALRILLEG